jgi:4-diphosphocytidyl-2-C-methyl-D-erythritol kinase
MPLTRSSPCKVNLLLNILGRRADGFHELETVMQPVPVADELSFARTGSGIQLTCSEPSLPVDAGNLVHRAAIAFRSRAQVRDGVSIHLEKRLPLAAGLGGGSSNAAHTLLGLNELFGHPLDSMALSEVAASLGSDVPFFLQDGPALAIGRGEVIRTLPPFTVLRGLSLLLIHPGFGISTPWAYRELARFPEALRGRPGRARDLIARLRTSDLSVATSEFYNSLEAPAFEKYPILSLYQEFLREHGALAALMSGSGSTTFALAAGRDRAEGLRERFQQRFGSQGWTAVVSL